MPRDTLEPGFVEAMLLRSALLSVTDLPSRLTMTSPRSMPAFAAGLPFTTPLTRAPFTSSRPRPWASSEVMPCTVTPSWPRWTSPPFTSWVITVSAMRAGMAKPMPMLPPEGDTIWELMPTS